MDLGKTNCPDTVSEMSSDSEVAQYFRGPGRFLIIPEFGVFYESLASYIITTFGLSKCLYVQPAPRPESDLLHFGYRISFAPFSNKVLPQTINLHGVGWIWSGLHSTLFVNPLKSNHAQNVLERNNWCAYYSAWVVKRISKVLQEIYSASKLISFLICAKQK